MVETITPVVYGSRARWIRGVVLHVLGATLTAAAFGAALAALGLRIGAPFGRAGLVLVAGVALVYAAGTLPGVEVPVPQLRRQVPDWWRTFFSPRGHGVPVRRRARDGVPDVPRHRRARRRGRGRGAVR